MNEGTIRANLLPLPNSHRQPKREKLGRMIQDGRIASCYSDVTLCPTLGYDRRISPRFSQLFSFFLTPFIWAVYSVRQILSFSRKLRMRIQ